MCFGNYDLAFLEQFANAFIIRGLLLLILLMKMRIFIIKNVFIGFQSIRQHDLYTFACAQTTCRSTFSTPIDTWFLNASTASSGDENR